MSDLLDDSEPGQNAPEFTVAELSGAVKRAIEGEFSHVRVRGEVGRAMVARTGHMYFDLKDQRAVIACVSWKGQVAKFAHHPEEGMEVIVTGRMTTYGPQSKYQLNVESVEPAGEGALMAMLEKRKKALAAEGLFDAARKQPIPYLPRVIGVVTSPTGAVIRDILHRLRDRFPRKVLVWPVVVQGERSAAAVAAAINGFNQLGGNIPRPDLLIVARGGGSLEDLWGFNDEMLVRAVANSTIPVISAVGHETDTTLIDHAADRRAPTPSAAAEMAVPVRADLLAGLATLEARRRGAMARILDGRKQRLRDLSRALPQPNALLAERRQRMDHLGGRLPRALSANVQKKHLALSRFQLRPTNLLQNITRQRHETQRLAETARAAFSRHLTERRTRLAALERMRRSLGYVDTLNRGFAVVHGPDGVVTSKAAARKAGKLEIEFADGRFSPTQTTPQRKKAGKPDSQGSLF